MDRARLSLNDPAFAGRLRQPGRSLGYVRRPTVWPTPSKAITDISQPAAPPKIVPATRLVAAGPAYRRQRFAARPVIAKPRSANLVDQTVSSKIAKPRPKKQTKLLYAMASLLFLVGLLVSINGFLANKHVAAQVKQLSTGSQHAASSSAAPSTTKPSTNVVARYVVAPNLPRYIDIAKLQVHARVLSLGILDSGALATPGNVYDAGWYNASAQPGQPGAMLVDGHISSWTTPGVFYGLNKLVAGDTISITRGDNKAFTYTVVKTAIVDAKSVDMSSMMVSADTSKPGLNLISCSGDVIPGTSEFDKRITVYAVEN